MIFFLLIFEIIKFIRERYDVIERQRSSVGRATDL